MRIAPALLLAASSLSGLTALPALAQTVAVADVAESDDIIITAQRRDERIEDVPVTVTAWSGEQLQRLGVTQFNELSAFVPGLNIQEQSANNPGFVIRGITSDSGSAQEAARVTVFLNGIDVSRSRGSYFDLFDIERVEVVKGPQATLFGTAAAIGAVSVITNRAREGVEGEIRGAIGNFEQRQLSGMVNAGAEDYGIRLAFAYKGRDGVVENIAGTARSENPGRPQRNLNGQQQYGARLSAFLQPVADLRLDLVVTYDGQRSPGTAFKSGTFRPFGGDTSPFTFAELGGSPQSRQVLGRDELGLWRDVYDVSLTARYAPEGSRWSYTGITGYREFDSLEVFDADGTAAWFLEFAEAAKGRQFSHESRVNFEGERLRGFAGVNYFEETGSQVVPFSTEEGTYLQCVAGLIPGLPCIDANGRVQASAATGILTGGLAGVLPYASTFGNGGRIENFSIFADMTFLPVPEVELTVGGRYLWETRRSTYFADQPNSVITGAPLLPFPSTGGATFSANGSNDTFLPRFNALWRVSDAVNLYATVSKGRRSPVIALNAAVVGGQVVPNRRDVPAETVWNYEGGVKGALGPVSFGGAIFYQTYENFQVTVNEDGVFVPRNAGSARNFGIEAEARWRAAQGVQLFGNVGWIDSRIADRAENGIFAGNRFRLQPEWQFALGADVRQMVGDGVELFVTPSLTYRSSLFFEIPNDPRIAEGAVALGNLRAGVGLMDGRLVLTGYATNLFDKDYVIDAGNTGAAFGTATFIRGNPRLFGVEAALRF